MAQMGRPKGSVNRSSFALAELVKAQGQGRSLIQQIYDMRPLVSDVEWLKCLQNLMKFHYPTLKSVEITSEGDTPMFLTRDNVAQLCEAARKSSEDQAVNRDSGAD